MTLDARLRHYRAALTFGAIVVTVASVVLPEYLSHYPAAVSLGVTVCWLWE